jgi:hypothetical protein
LGGLALGSGGGAETILRSFSGSDGATPMAPLFEKNGIL